MYTKQTNVVNVYGTHKEIGAGFVWIKKYDDYWNENTMQIFTFKHSKLLFIPNANFTRSSSIIIRLLTR